jgi:hypothetical protein
MEILLVNSTIRGIRNTILQNTDYIAVSPIINTYVVVQEISHAPGLSIKEINVKSVGTY